MSESGTNNGELRHVPGAGGTYAVTPDGRVFSQQGTGKAPKLTGRWRELRPWTDRLGRRYVNLGRRRRAAVHQLMLLTFIGPPPVGQVVRHRDGNPSNNVLTNLRYGTRADNFADMVEHGRCRLVPHNRAKLTESQAAEVRVALEAGEPGRSIARRYGVDERVISAIRCGRTRRFRPG